MLGLGGYPAVSLAEARNVVFANRQRAWAGGDPLAEKRHGLALSGIGRDTMGTRTASVRGARSSVLETRGGDEQGTAVNQRARVPRPSHHLA